MPKRHIHIVEVGPRDGLQNEPVSLTPHVRAKLVTDLHAAGLTEIEPGSFVSPKWVPQMAGTDEILKLTSGLQGLKLPVLVPNLKGLDLALAAGARRIALFVAATEAFARANLNAGRDEALARQLDVSKSAIAAGLSVRGSVSVAVNCPYEGAVDPDVVAELCEVLAEAGCDEIALCDTTGRGTPEQVNRVAERSIAKVGADRLAAHMHDTGGLALENTAVCLTLGIRTVDAAVGGLGGCPYSPGAAGNLSTNKLLRWAIQNDFATGVDLDALDRIEIDLKSQLMAAGKQLA